MAAHIDAVPVDKLEGLLQCSICTEMVKDPRTLPCFHSYCKECLDKFVKHHHKVKPNAEDMNCPVCRTKFTPGREGVSGMPRNYFICNMLEVMSVQNRVKGVPCSYCTEPPVGRCMTCMAFMCKKCLHSHNDFPGFRDHSVLSMNELSKPENKAKIKEQSYCKKHSKKKLKHYCETCNELICRYCMDVDHLRPDHVCLPLEIVAERKMKTLKENCSILDDTLNKGSEELKELTNVAQSLEDNMEEAKRKINQGKSQLLSKIERVLNEKADSLVKEAEGIFKKKNSAVVKQMEEVQTYVNKVKASADLSRTLVANGNDEEIVLSEKAVQENVEKIQSESPGNLHNGNGNIMIYSDKELDTFLGEHVIKKLQSIRDDGNLEIRQRRANERNIFPQPAPVHDDENLEIHQQLPVEGNICAGIRFPVRDDGNLEIRQRRGNEGNIFPFPQPAPVHDDILDFDSIGRHLAAFAQGMSVHDDENLEIHQQLPVEGNICAGIRFPVRDDGNLEIRQRRGNEGNIFPFPQPAPVHDDILDFDSIGRHLAAFAQGMSGPDNGRLAFDPRTGRWVVRQ